MALKKTAIVTGAASGIGLSITKHLVSKSWRVMMADVNLERGEELSKELGDSVLFHQTDVSEWDQQAALFKRTWEWSGRIDLFAANAGIDDRESVFQRFDDEEPKKPNLKTLEVDLVAVFYGLKLFVHYVRKNEKPGGKMVITASCVGLYPFETNPTYCAAKHGLVGLTRSIGPKFQKEGITVNSILPAFVPTGLAPAGLIEAFPKEHITPMSTILKAYDTFLESDSISGETVECSIDQLYFRKPSDYPDKSQRWLIEDPDGFWAASYARKRAAATEETNESGKETRK